MRDEAIAEIVLLRAEVERLAAACREFERKLIDANTKVSELVVKLNEARRHEHAAP